MCEIKKNKYYPSYWTYPKREAAIFDAVYSATGSVLLISECQDIIASLKEEGYYLKLLKRRKEREN
jgi:hypothetical protein